MRLQREAATAAVLPAHGPLLPADSMDKQLAGARVDVARAERDDRIARARRLVERLRAMFFLSGDERNAVVAVCADRRRRALRP